MENREETPTESFRVLRSTKHFPVSFVIAPLDLFGLSHVIPLILTDIIIVKICLKNPYMSLASPMCKVL